MKHWVRIAAALAACALVSGCAASRPAAKKEEPPGLSVRLPIAEAATLNIESQPSPGHPELPLSVADESRDRWLTLFEVNHSPAKPPHPLLPIIEEEP
ncbi:hypothetical protein [Candidatus Deferrimicrobium sp.]|uniref:hypothetical protein n=1 Tax=Candidatus Deferrimicrobium sp. TaxID=3060586 RepID=UPI00271BCC60|nr:hypothetical protein [Candidatus Deferrimicrobium sp.]MDO8737827.1 hypothetical protein [Candidatus Deferrimicrobium sp.]